MDREAWHTAAYGVAKSQTWLSDWTELRRKQSKNRGINSPDSALGMHQTLQGWIPCWGQVSGLTEEEGVMAWREGPTKSLEFRIQYRVLEGFPGGLVKNLPANADSFPLQETEEMQVWSLGLVGPLEKGMANHSNTLAWKTPLDRGAWQVIVLVPWPGTKPHPLHWKADS